VCLRNLLKKLLNNRLKKLVNNLFLFTSDIMLYILTLITGRCKHVEFKLRLRCSFVANVYFKVGL
jgi:hypothetical protein